MDLGAGEVTVIFNPASVAGSSTMLRVGWREGALVSCPGFTSVSAPVPSTRLMSGSGGKGPHPYFNPLFAAQSSTMLKGGWGAGGALGSCPGFYLSFGSRAQYKTHEWI